MDHGFEEISAFVVADGDGIGKLACMHTDLRYLKENKMVGSHL